MLDNMKDFLITPNPADIAHCRKSECALFDLDTGSCRFPVPPRKVSPGAACKFGLTTLLAGEVAKIHPPTNPPEEKKPTRRKFGFLLK